MAASEGGLGGRKEPQISANDLALYMVSSETTKLSIIRRNKYPSKHVTASYQDVKRCLIGYLADPVRDRTRLVDALARYEQVAADQTAQTSKVEEARLAKAVIEAFFRADNELDLRRIEFVEAPRGIGPLMLSGVKVTTNLDLLTKATVKGVEHGGGAILRLTRADDGESARERRDRMGEYVAALVFLQIEDKAPLGLPTLAKICVAVDIQHGNKFEAKAGSRRISDLKSACQMIATIWPTV